MKKILLICVPFFLFAFYSKYTSNLNGIIKDLKCDRVLHKKAFDICYSCFKKEPNAVAYTITKKMVKAKSYIRNLTFHPDYFLPRKCRSYSNDYKHYGYDRGHNAENATFDYNRAIQKETFLMSNISPQAKWLNRKYWAKLEKFTRYLAVRYGKIEVITGSCGSKGYLKNHVNIPAYWFKIVSIPNTRMSPIIFLAPNINKGMKTAPIRKYQSSLKKLEKICDF